MGDLKDQLEDKKKKKKKKWVKRKGKREMKADPLQNAFIREGPMLTSPTRCVVFSGTRCASFETWRRNRMQNVKRIQEPVSEHTLNALASTFPLFERLDDGLPKPQFRNGDALPVGYHFFLSRPSDKGMEVLGPDGHVLNEGRIMDMIA